MTRSRKGSYKKYKEEKTSSRIKIMKSKINYDRLSSLPDELIVSILSRLTAKEVAQTCILSKRLCNLWTLVPSLCFDIRDCNDDFKRFKEFVRKFLLKRDGARDIHSFRILCDGLETIDCLDWFSSDLSDWIKYAVEHNTRIFELSYVGYFRLDIPDCLFTCETLEDVKLKLQRWHLEELKPSAVCLPRLRKLDLTQIHFQDDHLEKILSGCPILEDLRLDDCELQISSFSCHSVKRLQLLDPKTCQKSITVSVPCVENLLFSGDRDCMFILKSISKLTHAIWLDGSSVEEEEHASHLLSSLSGVHDLEISSASVKVHPFSSFKFLYIRFILYIFVCLFAVELLNPVYIAIWTNV